MKDLEFVLQRLSDLCPKMVIEGKAFRFRLDGRWHTLYSQNGESVADLAALALSILEGETPWPEKWSGG